MGDLQPIQYTNMCLTTTSTTAWPKSLVQIDVQRPTQETSGVFIALEFFSKVFTTHELTLLQHNKQGQ